MEKYQRKKGFFYAISNGIRRLNVKENSKAGSATRERNLRNSWANNSDLIRESFEQSGEEIIQELASEKPPRKTRRESLFDEVGNMITYVKHVNCEDRLNRNKKEKKVRLKEDVITSQLRRLERTKKDLFQRLDNIVQGYSEEDENFLLLCHEMVAYKSSDQA